MRWAAVAAGAVVSGRPVLANATAQTAGGAGYGLVDLGSGGGNWSSARRINERGDVLFSWGYARNTNRNFVTDGHAGVWAQGLITDLDAVGMRFGSAIDDAGTVLGSDGRGDSLLYRPRAERAVPFDASRGDRFPTVGDISPIVPVGDGWAVEGPRGLVPLVLPAGFGWMHLAASSVAGDVPASASAFPGAPDNARAVLFRGGEAIVIGPAPGGETSGAADVNASGTLAGGPGRFGNHDVAFPGRAFVFDPATGELDDLGTLRRYGSSAATAINDAGLVVGLAYGRRDDVLLEPFARAFRFDPLVGVIEDLNELVDLPVGWVLTEAFDVNNRGEIVGRARVVGQSRAFLLRPIEA